MQFLDKDGKPVRPSFYTDNFFSLLPGEARKVTIETAQNKITETGYKLIVKGWNIKPQVFTLKK